MPVTFNDQPIANIAELALAQTDPNGTRQVFVVGKLGVSEINMVNTNLVQVIIDEETEVKYLYFPINQIHYFLNKETK